MSCSLRPLYTLHPKMKRTMKNFVRHASAWLIIVAAAILLCPMRIWAQEVEFTHYKRDTLIAAAKEIMEATRYCALITLDKSGHPQVRTMDPFSPDEDMVVWLGTNVNSRKVSEIRHDSRVTLYYEAPDGSGYAVIQGNAYLTDDSEKTEKYWKEEWKEFYPDKSSTFTLIKVIPNKIEVIYYTHGITGSSKTWEVPYIEF